MVRVSKELFQLVVPTCTAQVDLGATSATKGSANTIDVVDQLVPLLSLFGVSNLPDSLVAASFLNMRSSSSWWTDWLLNRCSRNRHFQLLFCFLVWRGIAGCRLSILSCHRRELCSRLVL